ncbi:MAG: menaquinone biosynthesis prenyltransferase MqnP [Campylobacterales bacterium]
MNFKTKIRDFGELVVFEHTIFSMPFIFIAMITAAHGWFGFTLLLLGALAAMSARNFAMAFNRYVDKKIDVKNPRTTSRPSVDGRLKGAEVLFFIVINAAIFVVVSYFINTLAFYLSFPFLFILAFYSYTKRFTPYAHIFLGLALGLAPIAGVVAVQASVTLWSIFLALGVLFWVAGFDVIYSLQDREFDQKKNLYSIPSIFGDKKALWFSRSFHILTVVFWFLFALSSGGGSLVYVAVGLAALMLFYEHIIVAKDYKNISRAFFTVNGYIGFVFLILVILNEVFTI